jgi:fumarylpyruvate hydrolase
VSRYIFEPKPPVAIEIAGTDARLPVNRIFCVGRNYAAHVREMGFDPDREKPCYFTKASHSLAPSGAEIPYPPATRDFHHEIELVVAIGSAGFELSADEALSVVYGYACGLDMTRRDLQVASRESNGPWDVGKDFENSAIISPIRPAEEIGHPVSGRIRLSVNGELRQDSDLENLIWSVPEILADLSRLYRLEPGDLVYTGTPDGVGPVGPGDRISGSIAGVGDVALAIRN